MAPSRQDTIAASAQHGILASGEQRRYSCVSYFPIFFYLYCVPYYCVQAKLFHALRGVWTIDEEAYKASFRLADDANGGTTLEGLGDMGYSGSTFFQTRDTASLVKSIPRHFEHSFFRDDMLMAYAQYMQLNPGSLLIRITDFLENTQSSIGSISGLTPTHHLVMENLLRGDDGSWKSWDLKPMSYFYPERDIAGGVLSSEATKSRLADDFNDVLRLDLDSAEEFKAQLEKDTRFLERCNAVDYSLFLVRIPVPSASPHDKQTRSEPDRTYWRSGVRSAAHDDGKKYVYKAAILDFFWAKHKVHAKAMTGLIKTYNIFDRKGPMSVTTTAPEYRSRFLGMCREIVMIPTRDEDSHP